MRFLLILLAVAGCVKSNSTQCGPITCPETQVCTPSNTCAVAAAVDACVNHVDGDRCSYAGLDVGVCAQSVCITAGCGNGIVEAGEACDDGNRVSFDHCSADCMSTESCGNGVIDAAFGEECDCGNAGSVTPGCNGPNSSSPGATCRDTCVRPRCGDSMLDPGEVCDDGNNDPGDGCRADCLGRWTPMSSGTFDGLVAVSGSAFDNVWAISATKVLHFDGHAWSIVAPPTSTPPFTDVWTASANDTYVVVNQSVYHWNGSTWTDVNPDVTQGTQWKKVFGRSSNDVWIAGSAGHANHWNGTAWTIEPSSSTTVLDLWESPTGTAWVTDGTTVRSLAPGGTAWQIDNGIVSVQHLAGVTDADRTAYGTGVGYHFAPATGWKLLSHSDELAANGLSEVAGETVAVGGPGHIVTCDAVTCAISPSGTTSNLNDVWSYGVGRAFVVGEGGTILY